MGRMSVNAGGGGADLDAITAGAEDIVSPKVGLDNEGEPLAGTLKDNSGVTKSAAASLDATNSRVQLTVPETGKYSLTSKLYATYATIRSLIGLTASKIISGNTILGLAGTATSDATISKSEQLLKDVIAYGKNGVKYVGKIASLAAKTYTPGTSNQTIAAGQYLSGAQTIKGDSNLKAANIKKGVNIFGITGTWEGYVKNDYTLIYDGFTNYDGYEENDSCVYNGYYAVRNTWTIDTVKTYDCDRANGVLLNCHKYSDSINDTASVAVYVYDTTAETWQLVKKQTILTANSAGPAAHYFNLGCKSGKLRLRFVLKFVNVNLIQMYV